MARSGEGKSDKGLILHGGRDEVVPVKRGMELELICRSTGVEVPAKAGCWGTTHGCHDQGSGADHCGRLPGRHQTEMIFDIRFS